MICATHTVDATEPEVRLPIIEIGCEGEDDKTVIPESDFESDGYIFYTPSQCLLSSQHEEESMSDEKVEIVSSTDDDEYFYFDRSNNSIVAYDSFSLSWCANDDIQLNSSKLESSGRASITPLPPRNEILLLSQIVFTCIGLEVLLFNA